MDGFVFDFRKLASLLVFLSKKYNFNFARSVGLQRIYISDYPFLYPLRVATRVATRVKIDFFIVAAFSRSSLVVVGSELYQWIVLRLFFLLVPRASSFVWKAQRNSRFTTTLLTSELAFRLPTRVESVSSSEIYMSAIKHAQSAIFALIELAIKVILTSIIRIGLAAIVICLRGSRLV